MKYFFQSFLLAATLSSSALVARAQGGQTLTGVVQTDAGEALPGATVFIKGSYLGAPCNSEGRFVFPVSAQTKLPLVLSVSFVGFETQSDTVRSFDQPLRIVLAPSVTAINEVVVSASRVEERSLQAPATVDKLNTQQLARLTSPDLIAGLARLKGVDVTTSGMFSSSLSTRGFGGTTTERFIDLVDYMDTQSPSLNFNPGNTFGLPEVDIASVEVLHGPSSALYGSNAFNGVVLTNSKDPFRYEGVSVRLRGGNRDYVDGQLRYAQRLGRRFAFKLVGSYARAQDWLADDESAQSPTYAPGNNAPGSNLGYDALNRYGDIGNRFDRTAGALAGQTVFMPGWSERELSGPDTYAHLYRIIPSLHYLVTDKVKAMVEFKRAEGNTGSQFTNRYRLKNFTTNQFRAELRSDNWFLRAYQTQDFGNESYDLVFTGAFMQTAIDARPGIALGGRSYANEYFRTYAGVYNAYLGKPGNATDVAGAQLAARQAAAPYQLVAGSPEYDALRDKVSSDQTPGVGSRISPSSFLNDYGGQYNFRPAFADIIVGGAYRLYRLGSNGLLFADRDGQRIRNDEYGGYSQVSKVFLDGKLKLTGAARVDGSQNFKTQVSPRASVVYSLGAQQQHNFRFSYNQAFRAPIQQAQYISLDLSRVVLLGNIGNGFQGYSTDLKNAVAIDPLKPEHVATFEVGYKGLLLEDLSFDVNFYSSHYNDFLGQARLIGNLDGSSPTPDQLKTELAAPQPFQDRTHQTRVIQVGANATQEVRAQGGLLALAYTPIPYLNLTANYSLNVLDRSNIPNGFQAYYNSPKHKYNVGAYGKLLEGLIYSVNYRWAQGHLYESTFATGELSNYSSLDAQLGYGLPKLATTLQLGASNLGDSNNRQVYGGPQVGRLLWAGLSVDVR